MGDYDTLLGTLLVGIFFNTYLYGFVTFQVVKYANANYKDPRWIRATVATLFLNDTVHTAGQIYMAWFYCVENYTNPSILLIAPWPYPFTPISEAISAILVHNFLGYRLYRLTEKKFLYFAVMTVATGVLIFGFITGIRAWIIHEVLKLIILKPIIITWLVGQIIVDLFLTCSLTFVLYQSRTGFKSTDSVIYRLIRGSVQTGTFASIFAMALLITYLGSPTTNLYGMFAMPVGRIYTVTLMDTLISRRKLKQELLSGPIDITTTVIQRTRSTAVFAKRSSATDVVNVRKDVYTDAVELGPIRSADDRKLSGYDNDHETHSSMWAK